MKTCIRPKRRVRERASAVLVFMAILAVMLLVVAANLKTLNHLRDDLKLLERRQIQRLQASQTNAPVALPPPVKP